MTTTLDLRNAPRLFYGATEAQALYYGGTQLWAKPAVAPTPVIAGTQSAMANFQTVNGTVSAVPGTQAGDVLVAAIALGVNNTGIITPPGWTRVLNMPSTVPPTSDGAVYVKVATGFEPESYTFEWTSSTRYALSLMRITGAVLPPHALGANVVGSSGPASAPAIATAAPNALLLDFVVLGNGLRTITIPAGMTQVYQATNNNANQDRCTLAVARREVAAPAAVAARSYALSSDSSWAASTLALRGA